MVQSYFCWTVSAVNGLQLLFFRLWLHCNHFKGNKQTNVSEIDSFVCLSQYIYILKDYTHHFECGQQRMEKVNEGMRNLAEKCSANV